MMKKYETYLKIDKDHQPSPGIEVINKLLPNVYRVDYDHRTDSVTFVTMESNHDDLVDLPSSEYETIINDVDIFLSDECKTRFEQVGFLHKFNILLYGLPGTGKTCLVNRVSQKIINKGGIVLFNPDPASLKVTFDVLNSIQPETQVLIIFEEMDQHVRNDETTLLHVLDGEIQKKNAMYIATTNYIEKIPARVKRPGRFSVVVEIGFPNAVAREAYLLTKLKDKDVVNSIVRKTEGFSIDELKEVVRGHYCMGKELNSYIRYVAKNSGKDADLPEEDDSERYDDSWDLPRDAEKNFKRALRNFVNKDGT
jgi:adenylate kinase